MIAPTTDGDVEPLSSPRIGVRGSLRSLAKKRAELQEAKDKARSLTPPRMLGSVGTPPSSRVVASSRAVSSSALLSPRRVQAQARAFGRAPTADEAGRNLSVSVASRRVAPEMEQEGLLYDDRSDVALEMVAPRVSNGQTGDATKTPPTRSDSRIDNDLYGTSADFAQTENDDGGGDWPPPPTAPPGSGPDEGGNEKTTAAARASPGFISPFKRGGLTAVTKAMAGVKRLHKTATSSIFDRLEKKMESETKPFYRRIWEFSFDPKGQFKTYWDVIILSLVIVSAVWAPLRAAVEDGSHMEWWEWLVDLFFYADICISFFTGFYVGMYLEKGRKAIAVGYIQSWFFLDVLTTVEWDYLAEAFLNLTMAQKRITSLLRVLKILRLVRVSPLVSQLTETSTVNSGYIDTFKFMFYVLITAHFLGCMFLVIPILYPAKPDGPPTWVTYYEIENMTKSDKYVNALYWSLTTMTTIGYGDRGPQTTPEIVYTMMAEVIGLSFFALLLNEIVRFSELLGEQERVFENRKNTLVQYMKFAGLHTADRALIPKVLKFLNFKFSRVSTQLDVEELNGFSDLSDSLKCDVKRCMNESSMNKIFFFGNSDDFKKEKSKIQEMFRKFDNDDGGELDLEEIKNLINSMGLQLTDKEELAALEEMDAGEDGEDGDQEKTVSMDEFCKWWFWKKCHYRLPYFLNTDEDGAIFVETLAGLVTAMAFSDGDTLVSNGEYGKSLFIVKQGEVTIQRKRGSLDPPDSTKIRYHELLSEGNMTKGDVVAKIRQSKAVQVRIIHVNRTPHRDSNMPIFGWSTLMKGAQRKFCGELTESWEVVAAATQDDNNFCEVFAIDGEQLGRIVESHFDKHKQEMWYNIARHLYNIPAALNDGRQDGVQPEPQAQRMDSMQDQLDRLQSDSSKTVSRLNSIEGKLDTIVAALTMAPQRSLKM